MRKASAEPKTKNKLLEAARDLILAKGYSATSVEDICRKVKLTKGSFFHYFKSKDCLAKEVLERFCRESNDVLQECTSANDEKDPLKRVYGYIDFAVRMAKEGNGQGCLVGTFAQEVSDTHPHIRSLCNDNFAQWAAMLKKDLEEAKRKYKPKASFDPQSLAEHFIAVLEGSQVLAKAKKDSKVVDQNMKHFKRYIESLFS